MMNGMMGWGIVGAILSLLIQLLLVAVLLAGLVYVFRALRTQQAGTQQAGTPPAGTDGATGHQRAQQLLDERYARGEIDHDDYEQRRRALGG